MSDDPASAGASVHATAVVVGDAGVLLRGRSGAGKSEVALALVSQARAAGRFARLVADDRVLLEVAHGRLIARPPPRIAGKIEQRGVGILAVAHEPAARLALVVDLDPDAAVARMPDAAELTADLRGVILPRLAGFDGRVPADCAWRILARLDLPVA